MEFDQRLVDSVKKHEGFRAEVYLDIRDIPTIGYGTRIDEIELDEETAESWLVGELKEKVDRLCHVAGYAQLGVVRRSVILEMAYWMGVGGTLRFKKMWSALRKASLVTASEAAILFKEAADEMRDSRTWRDERLRPRMERLAVRMESGVWQEEV